MLGLIVASQAITKLLIEEAAGLRYAEVQKALASKKDGHSLDHLQAGDLVEVTSGKLKGSRFVFVEWTTPQQLSAKVTRTSQCLAHLRHLIVAAACAAIEGASQMSCVIIYLSEAAIMCVMAQLRGEGEGGEVLGRSVNRSQLVSVSAKPE